MYHSLAMPRPKSDLTTRLLLYIFVIVCNVSFISNVMKSHNCVSLNFDTYDTIIGNVNKVVVDKIVMM